MKRVVLDTNVLVGSVYRPESASGRIVQAAEAGRLITVTSQAIRGEYEQILPRAVRVPGGLERLRALIEQMEEVQVDRTPRVVPEDPADDKLLAAAVAGHAEALITNDRRVLPLDPYHGVRILRPADFLMQLNETTKKGLQ